MNPDKINELIPVVHEMLKKMGEWDGYPRCGDDCTYCLDVCEVQSKKNAYLAKKLDAITYHIVMAMRARSEGNRADFSNPFLLEHWDKRSNNGPHIAAFNALYKSCILDTYEHHLAKSLLLTLDLMGFYGVEYPWLENRFIPVINESNHKIRDIISACLSLVKIGGVNDNVYYFDVIITAIMDIAELDKIDLEWHCEALMKYMKEVK